MPSLSPFTPDPDDAGRQLSELEALLRDSRAEHSERNVLMPFMKERPDLTCLIAWVHGNVILSDSCTFEHSFSGSFRCDAIVGSRKYRRYMLIEFEDAKKHSVFLKTPRTHPQWSMRLEHGVSQVFDWFQELDDCKQTDAFAQMYGRDASFVGMVIVGRSVFLDGRQRDRLRRREESVSLRGKQVFLQTWDDVASQARDWLEFFGIRVR